MKREGFFVFAVVTAGLLLASQALFGQAKLRDPFLDHSDTGDLVHVLPGPASIRSPHDTQPTVAPVSDKTAVYPASYGAGNLIDHGGLEIATAGFFAIYWNSSVALSNQTSPGYSTIQAQINAFVNAFADLANWDGSTADDYEIIQQYGSHAPIVNTFPYRGTFVGAKATQSSITDSKIRSYLVSLFNAGAVTATADTIYGLYFPPGMKVTLSGGSSCTSFCGYHSHFGYNGIQIKYAVFPYPNCGGCSISGLSMADMLTIVGSHEIREAVTDPGDNGVYAWYDSAGYEADDKCAWHNLYQMATGGFWVQPEYSNGGTVTASGFTATYPGPGCVVPR